MSVTLPFTEEAVSAIAALLGVTACREPYAVHGAAVYRLDVPNVSLGMAVTVLLWPSIRRVDVRIGDCSMVYKAVATVELLPGVEVIFRRSEAEGHLFVSAGGRVSVVT